MKKNLLFTAMLAASLSVSAQLTVDQQGEVSAGYLHLSNSDDLKSQTGIFIHYEHIGNETSYAKELLGIGNVTLPSSSQIGMSKVVFSVDSDGKVYSWQGVIQSSDSCAKSNVEPLASSMDAISSLRGVSFDYASSPNSGTRRFAPTSAIGDSTLMTIYGAQTTEIARQMQSEESRKRIGLIAQEVEAVLPDVVRTLPDGSKGIMYMDLIGVLVEGMKELQDSLTGQSLQIQNLYRLLEESQGTNCEKAPSSTEQPKQNVSASSRFVNAILYQNIPNPFRQTTEIAYRLSSGAVSAFLSVYDLNGKQLKRYSLQPNVSIGKVEIAASELTAGMYIYALVIDGTLIDSKRMVVE